MDRYVEDVIKARGQLESAIHKAVEPLVREWEKENGAKISDIDFDVVETGAGPKRKFVLGLVHVGILMSNGAEISGYEIR